MKRILFGVMLLVLMVAVTGCMAAPEPREEYIEAPVEAQGEVDYYAGAPAGMGADTGASAAQPSLAAGGALEQAVDRLIIRTGSITMTVEDTRTTQQAIEDMVEGWASEGAFVVSSNEYGGYEGSSPYINIQIRIPNAHFDAAMDSIAAMAVDVVSRDESGQDVTEEYVDLQARLEALETARQRLLGIMEEAQSTEDLLLAEQQLTQREAEIESIQGRMQYLEQSAALSSIGITLQPYILAQPVDTTWRPAETVRQAFDALLSGLRNLAVILIYFVVTVLPILAIIGLIIYGVVRFFIWLARLGRRRRDARSGQG